MTAEPGNTAQDARPAGHGHPARTPTEEAQRAIEETHRVLSEAVEDIASGDEERVARAYELAAGCADHFARALWFLRKAERDRERQPA